MANIFNGTTANLANTAFAKIQSVKHAAPYPQINVTGAGDSAATYERGIVNETCDIEVLGAQTVADNASGILVITWNDGANTTWNNAAVFNVQKSGSINGAILRTYTIRKTT